MKTLRDIPKVPASLILHYEVMSSWWLPWLPFDWVTKLAGKYYARKVRRKYARYLLRLEEYNLPAPK